MGEINNAARDENRSLNPDDLEELARINEEYADVQKEIDTQSQANDNIRSLNDATDNAHGDIPTVGTDDGDEVRMVSMGNSATQLRGRLIRGTQEELDAIQETINDEQAVNAYFDTRMGRPVRPGAMRRDEFREWVGENWDDEVRALNTGTNSEGGYLVDQTLAPMIVQAMISENPGLEVYDVMTTPTGEDYHFQTINDTGNEGEQRNEGQAATEQDIAFDRVTLNAYRYSSKYANISTEIIQDSQYDVLGEITEKFAERIARTEGRLMTLGTGAGQPQGIVTGAVKPTGIRLASGATPAAAYTYDVALSLKFAVNRRYRSNPMFRFMMNDDTLKGWAGVKDTQQRPLWVVSMREGEPDTFLGDRYVINDFMDDRANGKTHMLAGDMSYHKVRRVAAFHLSVNPWALHLSEETQVVGFSRMDSRLVNAGTNPIVGLSQAS